MKRTLRRPRVATVRPRIPKRCPGSRAPAGALEQFIVERIREVGQAPKVLRATLDADRRSRVEKRPELEAAVRFPAHSGTGDPLRSPDRSPQAAEFSALRIVGRGTPSAVRALIRRSIVIED